MLYYGLLLNNATILAVTASVVYESAYSGTTPHGWQSSIIVLAGKPIPGYWLHRRHSVLRYHRPQAISRSARASAWLDHLSSLSMGFCLPPPLSAPTKTTLLGALRTFKRSSSSTSGPNSTTFIVPGECFPTRYRSTSHGHLGRLGQDRLHHCAGACLAPCATRGAVKGATGRKATPFLLNHIMQILCAVYAPAACLPRFLIPETKRKTLEQLAGEVPGTPEYDDEAYGHMNRYNGSESPVEQSISVSAEKAV